MQKGIRHIRHCRHIPVANVPICGIGFRLIIKPKVDRGLEIGVVDHDIFPPVVGPIGIGAKDAWIGPLL